MGSKVKTSSRWAMATVVGQGQGSGAEVEAEIKGVAVGAGEIGRFHFGRGLNRSTRGIWSRYPFPVTEISRVFSKSIVIMV